MSGTNFNLHNGALWIGELQYAINQPADGEMVGMGGGGLPGTYKLGIWYNNEQLRGSALRQHSACRWRIRRRNGIAANHQRRLQHSTRSPTR